MRTVGRWRLQPGVSRADRRRARLRTPLRLSRDRWFRFAIDSPLEGTGFELSVPLGRIGASNSAWIAFRRRLGLHIEHAISIDGWKVCDGRTSWRFLNRPQRQRPGDRQCRVARLSTRRAAWLGLPRRNRRFREPHGQAPALAQRDVIGSPIRHSVPLLQDVMTAILVRFEWHGGLPRVENPLRGMPLLSRYPHPPPGSHR